MTIYRERLTVTHVITGLNAAGAENMLLKLLTHMDHRFSSDVISLTGFGAMAAPLAQAGIPVRALGMAPGRPDPRKIGRLARRLRGNRPDLIQTWTYQADLIGGLAGRYAARVPVIWGLRGGIDRVQSKLNTRVSARLCAALSGHVPTHVLSCSRRLVADHLRMGYERDRMVVIPNGFDTDAFRPDDRARGQLLGELGLGEDVLLVGLVARYHPQKDHTTFLQAAFRLARERPHVHFLLVGEGITPENPALAAAVRALGLGEQCHLLGPRADMPRLTAALDVAVSASGFGEGFSNAIGEAMASGVPCVGTDVGETAHVIADTGRVVPRRHPEALAGALQELLELPGGERRALGLRARRRIEGCFAIASVARQYSELYERVIEQTTHAR